MPAPPPRNSLSVALNHAGGSCCRGSIRGCATRSRRREGREGESERGRLAVARCRMREGKRKPRRASSLSRSQRHRSGDQIGHLGPAAGLQSDIRRRYCARAPCSPITQLRALTADSPRDQRPAATAAAAAAVLRLDTIGMR